jgi:hypothetical protein
LNEIMQVPRSGVSLLADREASTGQIETGVKDSLRESTPKLTGIRIVAVQAKCGAVDRSNG